MEKHDLGTRRSWGKFAASEGIQVVEIRDGMTPKKVVLVGWGADG